MKSSEMMMFFKPFYDKKMVYCSKTDNFIINDSDITIRIDKIKITIIQFFGLYDTYICSIYNINITLDEFMNSNKMNKLFQQQYRAYKLFLLFPHKYNLYIQYEKH